jgi:hypothetical protein
MFRFPIFVLPAIALIADEPGWNKPLPEWSPADAERGRTPRGWQHERGRRRHRHGSGSALPVRAAELRSAEPAAPTIDAEDCVRSASTTSETRWQRDQAVPRAGSRRWQQDGDSGPSLSAQRQHYACGCERRVCGAGWPPLSGADFLSGGDAVSKQACPLTAPMEFTRISYSFLMASTLLWRRNVRCGAHAGAYVA